MDKIHAKWGFGNAPLKPAHREKTEKAIAIVLSVLENVPQLADSEHLDAISHVKGQFTRTVKQDQWDWSTVWFLLGRPARGRASSISKKLGSLRIALKENELEVADQITRELREAEIRRYLDAFLAGGREQSRQSGLKGFLYILSNRSQPHLLKIGITQRTVTVRVQEINSATGVVVPFGIRAVWKVDDAMTVERQIHELLSPYRIRTDREFFEIEFEKAIYIINDYLGAKRMLERGK